MENQWESDGDGVRLSEKKNWIWWKKGTRGKTFNGRYLRHGDEDSLISRWPRAALIKSLSMARSDEIFTEFADDPGLVKVKHCRDVQEKCKRHNNSRAINIKK